jgi:hypothetical protein
MRCIWGPRSYDSGKGPQKSPHEKVAVRESRWISMDYPIALLTRIGSDFFGVVDILGCPSTLLENGPARTRTEDQGIHFTPPFPEGADYLFTHVGCGMLVPVIKRAQALR